MDQVLKTFDEFIKFLRDTDGLSEVAERTALTYRCAIELSLTAVEATGYNEGYNDGHNDTFRAAAKHA